MPSSAAPKLTAEQLLEQALQLPEEERVHLADQLFDSVVTNLATIDEAKAAACKQTDEARRAAVLDELTAEAQKLGLGY